MRRKQFFNLLILTLAALMTGCAGTSMVTAPDQEIQQPPAGESQVIFLRPSSLGAAISASLYEVVDDEIRFVGISTYGTAVPYRTTPGRHVFMVVSEAADFMEADLAPGRNYFSLVTPRMGVWAARFSLWPIKGRAGCGIHHGFTEIQSMGGWCAYRGKLG